MEILVLAVFSILNPVDMVDFVLETSRASDSLSCNMKWLGVMYEVWSL